MNKAMEQEIKNYLTTEEVGEELISYEELWHSPQKCFLKAA